MTSASPADRHARRPYRRQRGLSIIELMVGMVVAMLVSLAAVGSAASFLAAQRQGVGAGGAMISGTTALNVIRDDVTAAGLGFFANPRFLCPTLNLSTGTTIRADNAAFVPLLLTAGTNGDQIDVISGSQLAGGASIFTSAPSDGTAVTLRGLLPPPPGPTDLVSQAVLLAPPVPGSPCTVRTVTAATATAPQTLTFANTGAHNQATFTNTLNYPSIAGSDTRSRVTLLGTLGWNTYRLNGTDLELVRPLASTNPVVLARNVVAFRSQVGMTAAGADSLSSWNSVVGTSAITPANIGQVRALRIGIVTRSMQREKPDTTNQCRATETVPQLFGSAAFATTASDTDWRCFRYRTAIIVVPVRNIVMGTAS